MNRPWLLAGGLAALALCGGAPAAEPNGVKRLTVTVKETAGIRRFGYPVSAILSLDRPVKNAGRFRLLEKGRPVEAQFRPHGTTRTGREVRLDFNASPAPHVTRTYVVEYGPGVKPGPEPARGMRVVTEKDQFRVVHSPG